MAEVESASPESKKQKTEPLPEAPDEEWPEAWLIPDEIEDPKADNKFEPNQPTSVADLREIGISYWKMTPDKYTYPIKAVPWDPTDAVDPRLSKLRDDRGYSYADIITIHRDHLPNYDKLVANFFEEHIHDAEEIRHIIDGSGYFDVRDKKDRWVRIHVKKGDLMTLPEGIYHRFTADKKDYIHAMRLFIGQPVWTPFNRPCDDHPSRIKFVQKYVEEEKKESEEKEE